MLRPIKTVLLLRCATFAIALTFSGPNGQCRAVAAEHAAEHKSAESDSVSEESASGVRAVKLGEFSIRVYHTASSRKDTVSFIVHAAVNKDDFENFERIYSHNQNKVREQILVATRLVPIEDYDDPELKKFRRRIRNLSTCARGFAMGIMKMVEEGSKRGKRPDRKMLYRNILRDMFSSNRQKIERPGDQKSHADEIAEHFRPVFDALLRGVMFGGERGEGYRDQQAEENQSHKMRHDFLPTPMS